MIYLDSRYADGPLFKAYDSRTNTYELTVLRSFPSYKVTYFSYTWVETDRLDRIALRFLGASTLWWQIMDINPEVIDPLTIIPGTVLRIPNE
jgi:nucleoid-associated protein YgaU